MKPITLILSSGRTAKITTLRQFRALEALASFGPIWREDLDKAVGTSNSPQVISELRSKGLAIECSRVECCDRDGAAVFPGLYSLPHEVKSAFWAWQMSDAYTEWAQANLRDARPHV